MLFSLIFALIQTQMMHFVDSLGFGPQNQLWKIKNDYFERIWSRINYYWFLYTAFRIVYAGFYQFYGVTVSFDLVITMIDIFYRFYCVTH